MAPKPVESILLRLGQFFQLFEVDLWRDGFVLTLVDLKLVVRSIMNLQCVVRITFPASLGQRIMGIWNHITYWVFSFLHRLECDCDTKYIADSVAVLIFSVANLFHGPCMHGLKVFHLDWRPVWRVGLELFCSFRRGFFCCFPRFCCPSYFVS